MAMAAGQASSTDGLSPVVTEAELESLKRVFRWSPRSAFAQRAY